MGALPRSTRILIGLLTAAVVGLSIALFMVTRTPNPSAREQKSVAPAPDRDQGGFSAARPGAPDRPPARARNELGQPLNEDGRPIGPPEKLAELRNKPIAPGEVPITPPRFTDPAHRAAFKRWWIDELTRRVAIYRDLEPRPDYPPIEDTTRLIDALYDAAEPRAPGESVEQAYRRRQDWHALWKQFLDTHGATVQTVVSRGGDPQYGPTPAPPVQPPGTSIQDAPPAEPANDAPPTRSDDAERRPRGTQQ